MRVLVTGASGFLGRYLMRALSHRGVDAVGVVPSTPPGVSGEWIDCDLLTQDLDALVREARASHLAHLAWYAEHGAYWTSPLNLRWVDATTRLVESFCAQGGQRVVVAGTCAEYDWSCGYCREEHTPLRPTSLYGAAKDATHRILEALCRQSGVPLAWGRVFWPYGAGEASARLVPSLFDVFRGKREPFGVNAAAFRDFIHASDVAEAFATLLAVGDQGPFNVCTAEPVSIGSVVTEVARVMKADPEPVLRLAVERPDEPRVLIGENLRLRALGWRPGLSLSEGLARTAREVSEC